MQLLKAHEQTETADIAVQQKNFGKPVEWALVKDYPWSTPQLRKLDAPVYTGILLHEI